MDLLFLLSYLTREITSSSSWRLGTNGSMVRDIDDEYGNP